MKIVRAIQNAQLADECLLFQLPIRTRVRECPKRISLEGDRIQRTASLPEIFLKTENS